MRLYLQKNDFNLLMSNQVICFIIGSMVLLFVLARTRKLKGLFLRKQVLLIFISIWVFGIGLMGAEFIKNRVFLDAVKAGNIEQVKQLLVKKPFLIYTKTIFDNEGCIQLAAKTGNNGMVVLLLKAGADVNAKDASRITALEEAAFIGDTNVGEILLRAGADVNAVGGRRSATALHVAAYRGNTNFVELLLAYGADITVKDSFGKTPLQRAIDKNQTNVITALSNTNNLKVNSRSQPKHT